jgi:hypothetical protein
MLRDGTRRGPAAVAPARFRFRLPILASLLALSVILPSIYLLRKGGAAHPGPPDPIGDSPAFGITTSGAGLGDRRAGAEPLPSRPAEPEDPPSEPTEEEATEPEGPPSGATVGEAPPRTPLAAFIGPRGVPYSPRSARDTLNYAGVPGGRPEGYDGDSPRVSSDNREPEQGEAPRRAPGNEARFSAVVSTVSRLRNSGALESGWVEAARKALASLPDALDAGLRATVEISDVECYAAGCAVRMRYPDMGSFRRANQQLLQDPGSAFNSWPGARQRILPVTVGAGDVVSGWILSPS